MRWKQVPGALPSPRRPGAAGIPVTVLARRRVAQRCVIDCPPQGRRAIRASAPAPVPVSRQSCVTGGDRTDHSNSDWMSLVCLFSRLSCLFHQRKRYMVAVGDASWLRQVRTGSRIASFHKRDGARYSATIWMRRRAAAHGHASWYPSPVKGLLDRAGRLGLASQGLLQPFAAAAFSPMKHALAEAAAAARHLNSLCDSTNAMSFRSLGLRHENATAVLASRKPARPETFTPAMWTASPYRTFSSRASKSRTAKRHRQPGRPVNGCFRPGEGGPAAARLPRFHKRGQHNVSSIRERPRCGVDGHHLRLEWASGHILMRQALRFAGTPCSVAVNAPHGGLGDGEWGVATCHIGMSCARYCRGTRHSTCLLRSATSPTAFNCESVP